VQGSRGSWPPSSSCHPASSGPCDPPSRARRRSADRFGCPPQHKAFADYGRRAVPAAQQARGRATPGLGHGGGGPTDSVVHPSTRLSRITAAEQFLPPGKLEAVLHPVSGTAAVGRPIRLSTPPCMRRGEPKVASMTDTASSLPGGRNCSAVTDDLARPHANPRLGHACGGPTGSVVHPLHRALAGHGRRTVPAARQAQGRVRHGRHLRLAAPHAESQPAFLGNVRSH